MKLNIFLKKWQQSWGPYHRLIALGILLIAEEWSYNILHLAYNIYFVLGHWGIIQWEESIFPSQGFFENTHPNLGLVLHVLHTHYWYARLDCQANWVFSWPFQCFIFSTHYCFQWRLVDLNLLFSHFSSLWFWSSSENLIS